MSSNCCQRSGDSGAVEQVIKRSVGTSSAVTPTGLLRSILITVGMPTENVMPWVVTQSKNRPWENRLAKYIVHPVWSHGRRLKPCAELQPNERYSSVRS